MRGTVLAALAVWLQAGAVTAAWADGIGSTCPAAAAVQAAPNVASVLRPLLAKRGIGPPALGCSALRVQLDAVPTGFRLAITDGWDRRAGYSVGTLEMAAILIDTWAHSALGSALLSAGTASSRPTAMDGIATRHEATASRRAVLGLVNEMSYGSDASLWLGAAVSACRRTGRFCLGPIVRFLEDVTFSGDTERNDALRVGGDILLAADLPIRLGGGALTPGVAIGMGWLHNQVGAGGRNQDDDNDGAGLRIATHLVVSIPIHGGLAFDLGLSLDLAPMAHTSSFSSPVEPIPGEPSWYARGLAGLRYAIPQPF